jgi:hypothetical protein
MNATVVQGRDGKLGEYLQLLRLLACELERATKALAENSLTTLEDSIANQQAFAERLGVLTSDLSRCLQEHSIDASPLAENDMKKKIRAATASLEKLNRRYTLLLKHSSHSVALMVSLFCSFQGQIQEGSGPRLREHTWSCQI